MSRDITYIKYDPANLRPDFTRGCSPQQWDMTGGRMVVCRPVKDVAAYAEKIGQTGMTFTRGIEYS